LKKTKIKNSIKGILKLEIEEHTFEFDIECTIFGEVFYLKNLFLELPVDAQKMILGSNHEEVKRKLILKEKLLKYRIPFCYAGRLLYNDFEDKELDELIDKIFESKKSLGLSKSHLELDFIRSKWIRNFYRNSIAKLFGNNDNEFLDLAIFFYEEYGKLENGLSNMSHTHFPLGCPILRDVLPYLATENERAAGYQAFRFFLSKKNKSFLLSRYKKEESEKVRSAIIEGLNRYKSEDVYQFLIAQYQNKTASLSTLLEALSEFKTQETKTIAWKIFENFENTDHSRYAHRALIKMGVPDSILVIKMKELFYISNKYETINHILNQFCETKNFYLYPPPEDIFNKIEQLILSGEERDFSFLCSRLTAPNFNNALIERLYDFLSSENKQLQQIAVEVIKAYVSEYDFLTDWTPSSKIIDKMLELYENDEVYFKQSILECVGRMSNKIRKPIIHDILIEKAKNSKDTQVIATAIEAIGTTLKYIPYQELKLNSFLLPRLDSTNFNIKRATVKTLLKVNNKGIKSRLKKLENDPDKRIREIIESNDSWGKYIDESELDKKKELKKDFTYYKKMKYYLEFKKLL